MEGGCKVVAKDIFDTKFDFPEDSVFNKVGGNFSQQDNFAEEGDFAEECNCAEKAMKAEESACAKATLASSPKTVMLPRRQRCCRG
jgi:hypothetical protein